jgi:hypothetical protein
MQRYNQFSAIDSIRIRDDCLVFCTENQGVVFWGIRLKEIDDRDPPVVQGNPSEPGKWYPECKHLSTFLLAMCCWQCVNGALRTTVATTCDDSVVRHIRRHAQPMWLRPADARYELNGYTLEDVVIVVIRKAGAHSFYAASHDESKLQSVLESFGVDV